MKFIPILFSGPMVRALLAGRKIMTRRIIDNPIANDCDVVHLVQDAEIVNPKSEDGHPLVLKGLCASFNDGVWVIPSKYGNVGDVLWVRETAMPAIYDGVDAGYIFKADQPDRKTRSWKPCIHMPKTACRIFLQITDIRVERLQDITDKDAVLEGIESDKKGYFKDYMSELGSAGSMGPYASFMTLWTSLNGPTAWDGNPWVWVLTFKRINKPESFLTKPQ